MELERIENLYAQTNLEFIDNTPCTYLAKRDIIRAIAKMLEPYIKFEERPGYTTDTVMRGCLTVVRPGQGGANE